MGESVRFLRHPFAAVIALGAVTFALAPLSVAPSLTAASESTQAQAPSAAASYESPGPAVSLPSAPVAGTTEVLFPSTATAPGGQVPFALVDAYDRAVLASPTQCHLTVSLLSAIGQVESGNLAGETLDAHSRATPPVLGPLPDHAGRGALPDTDGGLWDESSTWDRGVGPMQLIPAAWRTAAVDLDGDGIRDPQDVYDAAGAAMVHLCSGGRDLATPAGLRAAVLDYHPTDAFLRLVLSWKRHFDTHPLMETTSGLDFLSLASAVALAPYAPQDVVRTAGLTPAPVAPTTELARPASTATSSPITTEPGKPAATPATPTADPAADPTAPAQATPTGAPPTVAPGTPSETQPGAPASSTAPAAPKPPPSSQPSDPTPSPVCPTLPPEATATPGATDPALPATQAPAPADGATPGTPEITVPPGCPPLPTITPTAPVSPAAP